MRLCRPWISCVDADESIYVFSGFPLGTQNVRIKDSVHPSSKLRASRPELTARSETKRSRPGQFGIYIAAEVSVRSQPSCGGWE